MLKVDFRRTPSVSEMSQHNLNYLDIRVVNLSRPVFVKPNVRHFGLGLQLATFLEGV